MLNTYTSYLLISRDLPKALDRVEKQPTVDRETDYYLANIGKVKTIEEFVKNDRLFKYAMKAHGLEDMAYAKAFMVKAMKEGISSSDSFANKLTDKRYAEFVKTYNFEKYGEFATSYNRALNDIPNNFATQTAIFNTTPGLSYLNSEAEYFMTNIGGVKSIDDFMADPRLLSFSLGAFGLDPSTEPAATIRQMLKGGVTDPSSPANSLNDRRYANFVSAFNFVEYGAATTTRDEVKTGVLETAVSGTGLTLMKYRPEYITSESEYFSENISKIKTVAAFMADKRLLTFAMASFGLDASTENLDSIQHYIESGARDPMSLANQTADRRYANFVAAFDFEQYGADATSRASATTDAPALWTAKAKLGLVQITAAYEDAETAYYLANVGKVESIDDLLADKRLLDFALRSYGVDPAKHELLTLRKLLEGGVADPNSPVNKLNDNGLKGFVNAFNFAEYGEDAVNYTAAQRPAVDKYVRQTLEENEGQQNEGVRLALYFERKSSTITSFYSILADPALAEVVRTALSLPAEFAKADIDKQVAYFESKLDIEDFQDPEKLENFLKRFTSLWEINNPSQSSSPQIGLLFNQSPEYGISTNLLLTMQGLKF